MPLGLKFVSCTSFVNPLDEPMLPVNASSNNADGLCCAALITTAVL